MTAPTPPPAEDTPADEARTDARYWDGLYADDPATEPDAA
jgi:hypothetical protein